MAKLQPRASDIWFHFRTYRHADDFVFWILDDDSECSSVHECRQLGDEVLARSALAHGECPGRDWWIAFARRLNAVSVQFGQENAVIDLSAEAEAVTPKNDTQSSSEIRATDVGTTRPTKLVRYHDLLDRLKFAIPTADRESAINDLLDDIEVALKDGRPAWFIRWLIVWNVAPFAVKRCGGVALWFVKLFVVGSG